MLCKKIFKITINAVVDTRFPLALTQLKINMPISGFEIITHFYLWHYLNPIKYYKIVFIFVISNLFDLLIY